MGGFSPLSPIPGPFMRQNTAVVEVCGRSSCSRPSNREQRERDGEKPGQELKAKPMHEPWSSAAYWSVPSGLLCLLSSLPPPPPGDHLPSSANTHSGLGPSLAHQSPTGLPTGQSHGGAFSIRIPSSQIDQGLSQVDRSHPAHPSRSHLIKYSPPPPFTLEAGNM